MGNHHNYNFADHSRNLTHMIRLEDIRVDPLAPEFAKPHPKQESIWSQQYPQPLNKADLAAYTNIGTEVEEWNEGIKIARRLARSVGMAPEGDANGDGYNDDGDSGAEDCEQFWHLFKYPSNTFRNSDVSDVYDTSPTAGDEDDVTAIGADIAGKIRNTYQNEHICMHATQSDRITFIAIFSSQTATARTAKRATCLEIYNIWTVMKRLKFHSVSLRKDVIIQGSLFLKEEVKSTKLPSCRS